MLVEQWFVGFHLYLIDTIRRHDWPDTGSNFWALLRKEFVRRGVTEPVAMAAIDVLAVRGVKHLDPFIEPFMACVRKVWDQSEVPTVPMRPVAREADAVFAAKAEAHWTTLPEADRDFARKHVLEKLPAIARWQTFVDAIAKACAYDPTFLDHIPTPAHPVAAVEPKRPATPPSPVGPPKPNPHWKPKT